MSQIFISYSHKDETFRQELDSHLSLLRRQEIISIWHDRRIQAGENVDDVISRELENSQVILLLISSDFIASDYCYGVEMQRALMMHKEGVAKVVPVIVRSCDWHSAPFGKLLATPTDGKPISIWRDRDEAFSIVAKDIRKICQSSSKPGVQTPVPVEKSTGSAAIAMATSGVVRSSNLGVQKVWTDRDKDEFLSSGFEFMYEFFNNSLTELESRNEQIETSLERTDSSSFSAILYIHGKRTSEVHITKKSQLGQGIALSLGGSGVSEQLFIDTSAHSIAFKPMGMRFGGKSELMDNLSAAEYYWGELVRPLQRA